MGEERSLADTPTWSVATIITVLVAICFLVQRSIYRFGKWLRMTRRKALLASLEKIKEELMLLGLISLMLGQWAHWISDICMDSSLFSSRFYPCTEDEVDAPTNRNRYVVHNLSQIATHQKHCAEGKEPFVSRESLEQLHRFLFLLGITHVLYSCATVVLAMVKIYSWRKWESQGNPLGSQNWQARRNLFEKRHSSFVYHHASHPWSRNKILIWMLCLVRQFKSSVEKSDYMALRMGFITKHKLPLSYNFHKYIVRSMEEEFHGIVGISWGLWFYAILCIFINIHGFNIYFWLSFIPAALVVLVGAKLQHVVAQLALEVMETSGSYVGNQLKPRDDLFWFKKPEILLRLIQFISFQNAFEMATFIWSLLGLENRSCFMKHQYMIVIRLASGVIVQFWCSYSTVPLNVIVTQMGSKCKKALLTESVRESLHSWCKRVKKKSKHDSVNSYFGTTRSTCSLASTIDEETITIGSGTLSRCSSSASEKSISIDQMAGPSKNAEDLKMCDQSHHESTTEDANYVSLPSPTTLAELLNFHDLDNGNSILIKTCEKQEEHLP